MATYSAFFSSGLYYSYHDYPSPARPSSPLPVPDDSDIEVDTGRESTPTPDAPSTSNPTSLATTTTTTTTQPRPCPRLRKRRSSLTVASTPMHAIRSPARAASAALQLQIHLASPSRSRFSGGATGTVGHAHTYSVIGIGNLASEATSLVGRMRSGSVGGTLRPRRAVRRLASVPAPAPPPTAPLPALPAPHTAPLHGSFPLFNTMNMNVKASARAAYSSGLAMNDLSAGKGRDRSYSVGNGYRIDEEMKEN